jgi:hypothetical protein
MAISGTPVFAKVDMFRDDRLLRIVAKTTRANNHPTVEQPAGGFRSVLQCLGTGEAVDADIFLARTETPVVSDADFRCDLFCEFR